MFLEVEVLSQRALIYKGRAASVILPGERGVFEIAPFHKRLLSRLFTGDIFIDQKRLPIRRGIAKVSENKVVVIAEEVL